MSSKWVPATGSHAKSMKSNVSKGTTPELVVEAALKEIGVLDFEMHIDLPGVPDFGWRDCKVAVQIHGCYWHRCPVHHPPGSKTPGGPNADRWAEKFRRNVERDGENVDKCASMGWMVFVFWECDVRREPFVVAETIKELLAMARQKEQV